MPVSPRPLALSVCAASAVVAAALLAGPADPAAAAAAATCQGRAATVTANPVDNSYQGTDGPDVVVTTGPNARVDTGAGADLVCVGAAMKSRVSTGSGADSVVVTDPRSTYVLFRVELGEGDDVFRGGAGQDFVMSLEDEPITYDQGFDTLDAGAGDDVVEVGDGDRRTHRVDLDLGPGADDLYSSLGGVTDDSVLEAGAGLDLLGYGSYEAPGLDVAVDAAARTIDRGGRVVSGWSGFERYSLAQRGARVRFVGSAAGESLEVRSRTTTYDVDMAGGRDTLLLDGPQRGSATGGPGRDRIANYSRHRIDLAKGTIGRFPIRSFQDATTFGGPANGDGRANDLVSGCAGRLEGRGGPDRLSTAGRPGCGMVAYGGAGNDVLVGRAGVDRLFGGTGFDRADGRAGDDFCQAERRRSC